MSAITTARPYARAAFGYARESGVLDAFSDMLETAAALAENPRLRILLTDPRLTRARRTEMLESLGGDHFDEPMRQLLRALGEREPACRSFQRFGSNSNNCAPTMNNA